MTNWTPIKDGLPEPGYRVMVFSNGIVNMGSRHAEGDRWVTLYPYEWVFDWEEEKREEKRRKGKGQGRKVTHWAELPKGPRDARQDQD